MNQLPLEPKQQEQEQTHKSCSSIKDVRRPSCLKCMRLSAIKSKRTGVFIYTHTRTHTVQLFNDHTDVNQVITIIFFPMILLS